MIDLSIHPENNAGNTVTLRKPLTVNWRGRTLTVPAGFQSDGCSTPEFLYDSVSPALDHRTIRAALVHDFIYRTHPENWSRCDADNLFYDLAREDGLSWFKAQKAYWGLRIFGGIFWELNDEC